MLTLLMHHKWKEEADAKIAMDTVCNKVREELNFEIPFFLSALVLQITIPQ